MYPIQKQRDFTNNVSATAGCVSKKILTHPPATPVLLKTTPNAHWKSIRKLPSS